MISATNTYSSISGMQQMQANSASVNKSEPYPQFGTIPASRLSSSSLIASPVYGAGQAESYAPKTQVTFSEEAKEKLRQEQAAKQVSGESTTAENKSSQVSLSSSGSEQLTEEQQKQVDELEKRDAEVRAHEQAHMAAAGSLSNGSASFEYENGPDGKRYAVGGEVNIDVSGVPGDPQATIQKAQQIQRAANAPEEPSSQDRKVATEAAQMEAEARRELNASNTLSASVEGTNSEASGEEQSGTGQFVGEAAASRGVNAYQNVQSFAGQRDTLEYLTDYA